MVWEQSVPGGIRWATRRVSILKREPRVVRALTSDEAILFILRQRRWFSAAAVVAVVNSMYVQANDSMVRRYVNQGEEKNETSDAKGSVERRMAAAF